MRGKALYWCEIEPTHPVRDLICLCKIYQTTPSTNAAPGTYNLNP